MKALLLAQIRPWKQKEQVALLDLAGFGQKEIALLLGTTPKAVSVRLAEIRKGKRAKGGNPPRRN
jgi:DNA-directed RNA polymerase specialized sigma24 family protein